MSDNNLLKATITIRNADTLSIQQKEARKAFDSSQSVDQTMKAFTEMEDWFDQSDLGLECLILARKLYLQGRAHKEVLRFGKRALKILNTNISKNIPCFGNTCSGVFTDNGDGRSICSVYHKSSLFIVCVLHVLSAACVDLKRFDDALNYLNLADKNLSELDDDGTCCVGYCVQRVIIGTEFQLYRVKVCRDNNFGEAATHMEKILEVKEKMLEEDCIELGEANMELGSTYYVAMKYKEAVPCLLKAVEIHGKHLGYNSIKVAEMRTTLGCIYDELGDSCKADQQRQLSESVLKKKPTDPNSPDLLIEAGRYEEAIAILNGVVLREDMHGDTRADAFISMAKAFCKLRKFADAKKHLRTARRLLEKQDLCQNYAAILFENISRLYEEMNDFDTAISLTKRTLAIPELPQNLRSNSSSRLFSLIFLPSKNVDEMIKALKEIEGCCEESDLGLGCWKIAVEILNQGHSPEEVISFGNRALRILIANDNTNKPGSKLRIAIGKIDTPCTHNHNSSLYIACVCNTLASACLKLGRYNESLSYLNWGNRNLIKLEEDGDSSCGSYCLLNTLLINRGVLFNLKRNMGRYEEAILPLRKRLETQKSMMEEGCIEIGKTNEELFCTYSMIMNYKEALPYCLKALEIYVKHLGRNSVEVARMMRGLALVYYDFKEYEKALEQNQLSQDILRSTIPNSPEIIDGDSDTGNILVGMGRYAEAIDVLKRVVSSTETVDNVRCLSFVNMAKAFYYLGKHAEAKKHMKTAQKIFEKKNMCPNFVAMAFGDMSVLYEKMNDSEKATSLLARALSMPNIPQKFLLEGSARLFSLISLSCKEKEGIAFMEDVVENYIHSFGPQHCEVGYGYKKLGAAYLKAGEEELAMKFMVKAKDILDVALGPHHLDSLKTSQDLAETYATTRRYARAVEIQEKLVECLKVVVPSEENFLAEAVTCLNKMKEMEADEIAESQQIRKVALQATES